MKRAMVVMVSLIVAVFGIAITASAGGPQEASNSVLMQIPFAFYAGNSYFPAGHYRVEMPRMGGFSAGTLVKITSQDGTDCEHLFSVRTDGNTRDTDYHVTFNKYGQDYFLVKVRGTELGADLPRSRTEKKIANEFAGKALAVASVEVVAVHSKAK